MIQIEKNIPIPEKFTGKAGAFKEISLAAMSMEIGESVFLKLTVNKAIAKFSYVSKKHGRKFTSRSIDGGTRVWRVA